MNISQAWLIGLCCLFASIPSYADKQGDIYNQNVANAQALAKMRSGALDAHDYCKGAKCAQIDAPTASQYYNDDDGIKNAAANALSQSKEAQAAQHAAPNRPTIDSNDPAYVNAQHDMADAYEISHGTAGKYTDCTEHQQCTHSNDERQCTQPVSGASPSCSSYPVPDKVSLKEGSAPLSFNNSGVATISLNTGSVLTSISIPWSKTDTGFGSENFRLYVNGQPVSNNLVAESYTRWQYIGWIIPPQVTKVNIKGEHFKIEIVAVHHRFTIVSNRGQGSVSYQTRSQTMKWVNNCTAVPTQCAVTSEACTEAGGTRTINGIPTTMSCWKKKRVYQCHYDDNCAAMPKAQFSQIQSRYADNNETHCTPTGEVQCSLKVLDVCVQNKATYTCHVKACHTANITCGTPSFCLDGECYHPKPQKNPDFAKAASELAAVNEGAKGIASGSLHGFTGNAVSCSKKPIGIANCCSDKGWGIAIDLTSCSAEEKGLMKAKKKGLTHQVGNYCAEKVLGVCIRHKETDCQYPNLLSRLVSEQGKPQLGKTFGSAKHPDCQGFTAEEMSHIDFSKIDLSPYYNDMKNHMKLPNPDDIKKKAAGDIPKS